MMITTIKHRPTRHRPEPQTRDVYRFWGMVVLLGLLSGCTVGPDYKRPQTDLPDQWHSAATPSGIEFVPADDRNLAEWWRIFDDPTLNDLVARAMAANPDLKQAEARIREARANRRVTVGGQRPLIGASGSVQRSRSSYTAIDDTRITTTGDQYQLGFDASWERGLFGGQRRSREAADADIQAALESGRDALVRITAEVAQNYIQLRTAQQQIQTARENLAAQEHTLALTRQRFENGLVSGLDVANAQAQAATLAARIPPLESSSRQTIHDLGILLGQPPQALYARLSPVKAIPSPPSAVPLGVPSELLRRRPDIRLAEARIHAATARIGVATAELFPKITLSGAVGFQADSAGNLFGNLVCRGHDRLHPCPAGPAGPVR